MIKAARYYIGGRGDHIEEQLEDIFTNYQPEGIVIRLVFFGNPLSNDEYAAHLKKIALSIHEISGEKPPVFSYVAQPPLEGDQLVMEVFEKEPGCSEQFHYKQYKEIPYIVIETPAVKELFIGGVLADSIQANIRRQSDEVFAKMEEILSLEGVPISSIIRQWNYIEQISKTVDGHQNYQDFNESRTCFYNKTTWENTYPAATGVGGGCMGVMVDVDVLHPINSDIKIVGLNNRLQVPAYAYSSRVLCGENNENTGQKATPKFERAKLVLNGKNGWIYISGTAAIRGEMSLADVGIEEQTRITIENIEDLISKETLVSEGIDGVPNPELHSLRIYLKDDCFFERAKSIVDEKYVGVPKVYLKADVCRNDLLIEIEGLASINY